MRSESTRNGQITAMSRKVSFESRPYRADFTRKKSGGGTNSGFFGISWQFRSLPRFSETVSSDQTRSESIFTGIDYRCSEANPDGRYFSFPTVMSFWMTDILRLASFYRWSTFSSQPLFPDSTVADFGSRPIADAPYNLTHGNPRIPTLPQYWPLSPNTPPTHLSPANSPTGLADTVETSQLQSFTAQWDMQILYTFGKTFERFPGEFLYIAMRSYM